MRKITFSIDVRAPFATIWELMLDRIEHLKTLDVFPAIENGTAATFNLDFHYDFPLGRKAFTWAGAGLGILYSNPEGPLGSNTDPAANILFGLGINKGSWIPYIQAKVIAADNSDFVFGGGIRFVLE